MAREQPSRPHRTVPRLRKRRILLGVRRFPFATLSTRELVTPHSRLLALDGQASQPRPGAGASSLWWPRSGLPLSELLAFEPGRETSCCRQF
jgi:hypothetical protein